jgi:hypothetical protein
MRCLYWTVCSAFHEPAQDQRTRGQVQRSFEDLVRISGVQSVPKLTTVAVTASKQKCRSVQQVHTHNWATLQPAKLARLQE